MSDVPQPGDPRGPFGFQFDLSQMARMLQSEGPVNWDVAAQMAAWVASADPSTGEQIPEAPIDPARREHVVDLVRAAQGHVADATGIAATYGIGVRVEGRRAWADATLRGLHPVLETLAERLSAPAPGPDDAEGPTPEEIAANPLLALTSDAALGGMLSALAPLLLGVQAGSMVGFLAQRALGQYDLPLALEGDPELIFVAGNIDDFASEWTLDRDDVYFALALREVVHAAVRTIEWVRDRMLRLACDFVGGYEVDHDAIAQRFGDFDPTDPSSLGGALDDPAALLGALRTPAQDAAQRALVGFASLLEGYTDHVVGRIGSALLGSFPQVDEALRRHRVERGREAAFIDQLLGLEVRREHYEAGLAFCDGVAERSGAEGLNRLWEAESMLPTEAEFEAPGLWLARIDLGL